MKLKKRIFAITGAGVALSIAAVSAFTFYSKAATKVDTYTVTRQEMNQVTELNGKIQASDSQTYYAGTNVKVDKVHVKVGDTVKKGDLLISFDEEEINNDLALLDLDAKAKEGSYLNAIQTSDKYNALYAEAKRNLGVLNQQIAETEEAIINKQKEINDRSSTLANEGAKLQVSIIDWSDRPESDEYSNLRKLAQNNAYVQSYDSELLKLQEELARLNVQLADFKEYKAEMTSQKASSYPGVLTEGGREELDAVKEANELTYSNEIAKLEEAKKGIRAEFTGVVTEIDVTEGSSAALGMPLVKVDSLEDVVVRCDVNKYDIIGMEEGQSATVKIMDEKIEGRVDRIEKIVGSVGGQSLGVGVDIKMNDMKDVFLGYEVKAYVNTASVEDTICVPNEAVVTEDDETFVFVSKDKKAVKTKVETGVKNDNYTEIVSGLNDGETVVWSEDAELKNGEEVRY